MLSALSELSCLIETRKLWEEMSDHIFALGGELWETKYAEAYNFHEELVYKLIVAERGYESSSDNLDFDCFQEAIYDLVRGNTTKLYDVETGELIKEIANYKDLYNFLMHVAPA